VDVGTRPGVVVVVGGAGGAAGVVEPHAPSSKAMTTLPAATSTGDFRRRSMTATFEPGGARYACLQWAHTAEQLMRRTSE
jgi:2-phospho-L-lactate transferase/gluconeogenesis factor (CofD/UPF0052 family)